MRIADYGKGVPPEIKGMIFQEGFRYGEMGNTGLGLYIVKKTMERYGGQVSVEDNQPKGAVFVLRFKSGGPSSQTR
jgi:signal transduction histidine kinase